MPKHHKGIAFSVCACTYVCALGDSRQGGGKSKKGIGEQGERKVREEKFELGK